MSIWSERTVLHSITECNQVQYFNQKKDSVIVYKLIMSLSADF